MSGTNKIVSTRVITTSLAFADIDSSRAQTSFDISPASDCWTLHVRLTQPQFDLVKTTGIILSLKVYRADNSNIDVNRAGPFLTRSPINISLDALSQGYGACRFPSTREDEPFITGTWIAKLIAGDGSFGGLDVTQVPIWLVERRLTRPLPNPQPAIAPDTFSLPVKFVLVTPEARKNMASTLWRLAVDRFKSVYYRRGIDIVEIGRDISASEVQYNSDLRAGDLAQLVDAHATPSAITVFTILNFDIAVDGGLGFSMLPGPQGFQCGHSAAFAKLKIQDPNDKADVIGHRIAHEVGHYLGLVHTSSCLDTSATRSDIQVCKLAISRKNPANADKIQGNLMFTGNPGSRLSSKQVYQLMRTPFVTRTVNVPRTRVRKLTITVHTGVGFKNFLDSLRLDAAGTDDNVHFQLFDTSGAQIYTHEVSSWGNDFEQGDVTEYQLDPKNTLYVDDINGFRIVKSFNYQRIGVTGVDDWLLQGLTIKINGQVWYDNDNIHRWLDSSQFSEDSSFSAPLYAPASIESPQQHQEQHLFDEDVSVSVAPSTDNEHEPPTSPPPPFYATPPFSSYPTALQFEASANSRGTTSVTWADLIGTLDATDGDREFSLQAWIRPEDTQLEQAIVSAGDATGRIFLRIKGGCYEFGARTTDGQEVAASAPIPPDDLDRWIHVCGAYDGTHYTIHRNGAAMVQTAASQLPVINGFVSVGAYPDSPSAGFLNARLRNVAIWKAGRSADEELRDLFFVDPSDPNLAAYWPLDDGDGTQPYDASDAANDLTIVGATWSLPITAQSDTLYLPSSPPGTPTGGPADAAPFVTISGDKLSAAWTTADTTIGGWFRIGAAATEAASSTSDEQSERLLAANGDLVLRYRNGHYEFGLSSSGGQDLLSLAAPPGDLAHWVYLIGQYDATERAWVILRNGHQMGRQPAVQGYGGPSVGCVWTLGGQAPSSAASYTPHSLELRQIALFHAVTPIARFRKTYMQAIQTLPPPQEQEDGLVGYWPANDGAGNTLYDQSVVNGDTNPTTAANGVIQDNTANAPAVAVWTTSGPLATFRYIDVGDSIDAVIRAALFDAGPNKPYTLHLGPGTFNEQVMLPAWCSLAGAGESTTEIITTASATGALAGFSTIELFGSQSVRQLTVSSAGSNVAGAMGATVAAIGFNSGSDVLLDQITARGIQATFQGLNIRVVSINQLSGGPFSNGPANRLSAVNCTVTVDTRSGGQLVLASGSDIILSACSVTGGIEGVRTGSGLVFHDRTAKLYNCVVQSATSLDGDPGMVIIAHGCQLSGSIGRCVTVLPS